jgi:mannose-1-phosphate guanylyltransferase
MNAIILAAGLGRRLKPITDRIPKPLLPIIDRPVIDIIIDRLKAAGASRIGINLFHLHTKIAEHLSGKKGLDLVVEKTLTDTGGPLIRFPHLFTSDVIIHNCDVLSNFDLSTILAEHRREKALATLVLTKHPGTDLVQTEAGRIVKFHRRARAGYRTYAGIAVCRRELFDYFPAGKATFSIKEAFSGAIRAGQKVIGRSVSGAWYDIGSPSAYWRIHHDVLKGKVHLPGLNRNFGGRYIAASSRIETKNITGFCSIGDNCQIGRNVRLNDVVVLPNTSIKRGDYDSVIISHKSIIPVK